MVNPALVCVWLALAQSPTGASPSKLGENDVARPAAKVKAGAKVTAPAAPAVPVAPAAPSKDPLFDIATALDGSRPEAERVAAVNNLAGSSDERVSSILVSLAKDRSRAVSFAAVQALGATPTPRAEAALVAIVKDTQTPFGAREEAIRTLGKHGLETTPEALESLTQDRTLPGVLTTMARKEIETNYPGRSPVEVVKPEPVAPRIATAERAVPALLGAGFGGYALWTVGILGQNEAGGTLGLLTGAALGGAAGYLLAPDLTATQTMFYGTTTGIGLWAGLGIGLAAIPSSSNDRFLHLFGLGGEVAGALAAYHLWDSVKLSLDVPGARNDPSFAAVGAMIGIPSLHLLASLDDRRGVSAETTAFKTFAVGSGLAIGAGVGTLLGRYFPDGRGNYVATGTAWGLGLGLLGATSALADPQLTELEGAAILGGLAGIGASFATYAPELTRGDLLTINMLGLTGATAGLGIASFMYNEGSDRRGPAAVLAVTSGAGLVAGRLVTQRLSFKGTDPGLVGLTTAHFAMTGILAPDIFGNFSDNQKLGTLFLATAGGVVTGGLLAQQLDLPQRSIGAMFIADFFGSIAGWGGGLLATRDAAPLRALHAPALLAGTAGLVGAGIMSNEIQVSQGDAFLIPLTTFVGLYNGVMLTAGVSQDGRKIGGATLLGAGLGGLSGLALSQTLELTPGAVAAAGSGLGWGTYLAISSLAVVGKSLEQSDLLIVLAAGDIGLGVTSMLLSPTFGVRPVQIGIASLFGVGGAAGLVLVGSLFTREPNVLLGANLIGGVVGLATGAYVASTMKLDAPATAPASTDPNPDSGGGGGSGAFPIRFQGVSTAPLMDRDGRMGGAAVMAMFQND